MRDWRTKLDDFLKFNDRSVLERAGGISREEADQVATEQYELFEKRRMVEVEARAEAELSKELESLGKKVTQAKRGSGKTDKK